MNQEWIEQVKWDERGLVAAVAQDAQTRRVLMMAWMNREALLETVKTRRAVYFSRSRNRLWRKGEESGHTQQVQEIRLDCDADLILLLVEQTGGIACHTGRESCLFLRLESDAAGQRLFWDPVDPVLKDPQTMYAAGHADPGSGSA